MSENLSELTFDQIEIGLTKEFNVTITQSLVDNFAKISGDFSPIHMNDEFAKSTKFGKRIVLKIIDDHPNESPQNILRTFIAYTAKSITSNLNKIRNFTPSNSRLFISGGGIHHPILLDDLKNYSQIHKFLLGYFLSRKLHYMNQQK